MDRFNFQEDSEYDNEILNLDEEDESQSIPPISEEEKKS